MIRVKVRRESAAASPSTCPDRIRTDDRLALAVARRSGAPTCRQPEIDLHEMFGESGFAPLPAPQNNILL
ncbi:hypothetical protein [Pseudoduganella aquatica]|uniref:Uncharacterized protein n=1 Tax=Pseudoduganella aquatica TaxID=2660641 RepID=A0A7X4HI08_9BURK|nr:hypothetical protein [Pseudoduganella aquatica]MYN11374.1 hypothetical protein [Pseudoduganella aquatica]